MAARDTATLREGFTTGTASAAAARAALRVLLGGETTCEEVVPLPPFSRSVTYETTTPGTGIVQDEVGRILAVPIASVEFSTPGEAVGRVIKDGGDDPDATHGAVIEAHVRLTETGFLLEGGRGVGRVTLPGLPVAVGEAAINPQPRLQIAAAVGEVCRIMEYAGGVAVRIEVPEGAVRARNTMNARLGIVGGISILGTRGTVRPYSHSSWKATIAQGMDVARAAGCTGIGLSTGRRSERLLMAQYPGWPELAFVQAADFVAFSLEQAVRKEFDTIAWGCFFGKLVKLAQGHDYTHARTAPVDFATLAVWCAQAGADAATCSAISGANTARQVLDIIEQAGIMREAVTIVAHIARDAMHSRTGGHVALAVHVFDFDGRQLVTV